MMRAPQFRAGLERTLMALAVSAAFAPAYAQEVPQPNVTELTAPGTSSLTVEVGAGYATGDEKDRARFGLYNGLRRRDVNGLFDFEYANHNSDTGRWITFEGRNLGLDSRELNFSYRQLGEWKFNANYSEIVRHDPRAINTGLSSGDSTTPTVNVLAARGTGTELNLELKRKILGFSGEVWLTPRLQFEASFRNEDKDGSRIFGRGFTCPSGSAPPAGGPGPNCGAVLPGGIANQWALLLLPEPINSTTRQVETKLTLNGDKYLVTAGYYGSFYDNAYGSLTPAVPGTLVNGLGTPTALDPGLRAILQLPMALPPDNQAHQFSLTGNYRFTPTTIATFKYAYTHATQDQNFGSSGLAGAPAGVTNLNGELNTNLVHLGLTAKPLPKLSVLANLRYEDRNDTTPIAAYNTMSSGALIYTFTNGHNSLTRLNGKLEGTYQLPQNYRVTLGGFYEEKDRGTFVSTDQLGGISAIREKTDEWGGRVELRKPISETLTGALGYERSWRNGSTWLRPNAGVLSGVTPVSDTEIFGRTNIYPYTMTDRRRDMTKLSANWQPLDRLSVQVMLHGGADTYSAPTSKGLKDSSVFFASVDASYALNNLWRATAYVSHGQQNMQVDHSTGYQMALKDITDSVGFNITGKPYERLQLGGDITFIGEKNKYDQTLDALSTPANQAFLAQSGGLPDVTYRLWQFKLFGDYAVEKNSYVRLNLIHYRSRLTEWTWANPSNGVPFFYSDNTIVTARPDQHVTFLGASYVYRFR